MGAGWLQWAVSSMTVEPPSSQDQTHQRVFAANAHYGRQMHGGETSCIRADITSGSLRTPVRPDRASESHSTRRAGEGQGRRPALAALLSYLSTSIPRLRYFLDQRDF